MARMGHCVVQIQETVWITGGNDGNHVLGDIWQLSLETMQWSRHGRELPIPVHHHAMTVTDEGKMVVFGGVMGNEEGETLTDAVQTTWLKVPSLRTMAWEVVCHLPASTLVKEGIPRAVVEMLSS